MIELLVGLTGMTLILVAFILDEFYQKFDQNTPGYNFFNLIGSGLLGYYAYLLSSVPFMILNGVWCVTALVKLVLVEKKKK